MEIGNKPRLLKEIAKAASDPEEFIKIIKNLQGISTAELAARAGITQEHFYVVMSQLRYGQNLTAGKCVQIAEGLNIDPYILGEVAMRYSIKKVIDHNRSQNVDRNEQVEDI